MKDRYLEVTYQNGRALAAYLYLPRRSGVKSVRTERTAAGLLIDYSSDGDPIGIEITAPALGTVEQISAVLVRLGHPGVEPEELRPLRAA